MVLVASDQECNETDVRVVGGPTPTEGLVEICLNGVWGSVCGDRWDTRDAKVVCRQLGYNGCKFFLSPTLLGVIIANCIYSVSASVSLHSSYVSSSAALTHLSYVYCNGNEDMLSQCGSRSHFYYYQYWYCYNKAGAICNSKLLFA